MRGYRFFCSSVVLGLVCTIAPLYLHADSDLEEHLRYEYADKTLVIRNFYHGGRLNYDSAGSPANGSVASGDWTVDGFVRVASLSLSGLRLTLHAERLSVIGAGQILEFQRSDLKKNRVKGESRLRIEVELDPNGITVEKADAALSRVFLTTKDRFADLMPDYWRPCILAASNGKGTKKYSACRFSSEVAAVPGVVSGAEDDKTGEAERAVSDLQIVPIRKGVTPPRPQFAPDPEFSAEAQKLRYQGVITLMIVVDQSGHPRDIRILQPLGMGLDRKAVDTIARWQFSPAEKDGQPVSVEMAVQINFHLF